VPLEQLWKTICFPTWQVSHVIQNTGDKRQTESQSRPKFKLSGEKPNLKTIQTCGQTNTYPHAMFGQKKNRIAKLSGLKSEEF